MSTPQDPYLQSHGGRIKHGMREWLSGIIFTHWVTLSFHRQYSLEAAQRCLQLWFMDLNSRMLRSRRFDGIDTRDLVFFVALPEHTRSENIHWHLLVKVAPELHAYFERLAGTMWKRIVSSGTSEIQQIQETVDDHLAVQAYATKGFASAASHESFVTSNMLGDGRKRASEKQM